MVRMQREKFRDNFFPEKLWIYQYKLLIICNLR